MNNRTTVEQNQSELPCIAVVDDDRSFLRSVGRLLRSLGYSVQTFGSAREFLDRCSGQRPDCLVLDVHMPDMGGPELHYMLLNQGYRVPVVFVPADVTPQTLGHLQASGSELLLKPFDQAHLVRAISAALKRAVPDRP